MALHTAVRASLSLSIQPLNSTFNQIIVLDGPGLDQLRLRRINMRALLVFAHKSSQGRQVLSNHAEAELSE
jgi:hypothetical protein